MRPDPAATPSRTARLLARLTAGVSRHPRLVLLVGLLLAGASVWLSATRLEYHTQRNDLMGADREHRQRWAKYLAEFGDDDDMVVVVEGADPARMGEAIEALADAIRSRPDLFDRLFYKVDLRRLGDRALLYLPEEQIREIRGRLDHMSVLLGPLAPFAWKSLTLQSMLVQANWCLERRAGGGLLAPADEQLLNQLPAIARAAAATLDDPDAYRNPWSGLMPKPAAAGEDAFSGPGYFFSPDKSLAFLLVRPAKQAASFTPAREAVECLRGVIGKVRGDFPGLRFGLTGLPVLENDEMVASEADSNRAAWLALAAVTLLYFFAYRRARYPLLTVGTLLLGTVWALGWLTLTVGHLNILSAAFAVMLIGMGDYGVLWVARYEAERAACATTGEALQRTALHAGPGILTAALTTSLAFFATMLADFKAVAELGWIAGCGVLLCALACFTAMPALLALVDRGCEGRRTAVLPLRKACEPAGAWLPGLSARPGWVVGAAAVAFAALGVSAWGVRYDHNLLHMQAKGLDSVEWERRLIDRTAGASWNALSYTETPEQARALRARYERLPEVSRVVEVASLIPEDQEAKLPLLRELSRRLEHLPPAGEPIEHPDPDPAGLRQTLGQLIEHLERSPLPAGEAASLLPAAAGLLRQLREVPSAVAVERLRVFERRLSADLASDLRRLRAVSKPEPITLADLPPSLRERYVGESGKWLVRVFARQSLWEYEPLEHFVNTVRAIDPEATGKPFGTLEGLRAMKSGFQWAGVYALLAIVGVLALDFRRVGDVLLVLLPLVLGVVTCVGLLSLFGVAFNPANLIALPLIVGVGVDNGVHVLHDYRSRGPGGPYTLGRPTGRGVLIAGLTTMLGFGALMLSHHQGLVSLGLTLTLGVGCCMLAALVVLPAVLRLIGTPAGEAGAATVDKRMRLAA